MILSIQEVMANVRNFKAGTWGLQMAEENEDEPKNSTLDFVLTYHNNKHLDFMLL